MEGLDRALFLWINAWAGHTPVLDWLTTHVVSDYLFPGVAAFALLGMWFAGRTPEERERFQRSVLTGALAIGAANAVVAGINAMLQRPRPFVDLPVYLLFYPPTDPSFPSNPIAVTAAGAAALWAGNRGVSVALWVCTAIYGFARVYAGVCYPLDVVGGALVGALGVLAAQWTLRLIEPLPTWLLRLGRALYLA